MLALRLAPIVLALVVLAAHCYRAGAWLPLAAVGSILALLPLRRRWVPLLVQVALLLGTLEWLRTTIELVAFRQSAGLAWMRMAAILGAVAMATLLAALTVHHRSLRNFYRSADAIARKSTRPARGGGSSIPANR